MVNYVTKHQLFSCCLTSMLFWSEM